MRGFGYRTMKTAGGAAVAIWIAELLQLDFYVSAGIIAVLCIQKTRRKSFVSAWERLIASVIGLFTAGLVFEVVGYAFYSVAIVLMIFIPITVRLKITSGIVTSIVIMLHVYTMQSFTPALVVNEMLIIVIGVGIALLMNVYIPSNEKILDEYQVELEQYFSRILKEFAHFIRTGEDSWTGREITEAAALLHRAKNRAVQNLENHILRYEDTYYHYFKMREKQLDILERMMPLLTTIDYHVKQADMLASFLDDLAEGVQPGNTAHRYLEQLEELKQSYKEMNLPSTREEFEARASLAHLVYELDLYLQVKQQFRLTKKYGVFKAAGSQR
ncbi:hypothetical protein C6I21_02045 [Alkalicoccus urumqiensis]|uniref:Putative aromatic acid exporter C-terminal domain-containing protein n=2 Tax=Alkalicoccus urumqiensis TaxID=1548213 RepID=A0A2P6MKE2_ALKUR|nr:hypothetical protein C6I21_02045 [Alkalicoccus urumqiensis]